MKYVFLLLTLAAFSISCTQQVIDTDGSSSLESRIATPTDLDQIPVSSNFHVATCSTIKSSVNSFNAVLLPHRRAGATSFTPDQMQLHILTVPLGTLNGTEYVQFFKESDELGIATTNPIPVEFKFIDSNGNELDTFTPINELSQSSIERAIEESGLGTFYMNNFGFEYTPAQLINNYEILLTGLDTKYESIRTAFYSSTSTVATSQIATLLPSYAADPNDYATLGKSSYLESLHPMASRINSGLSDLQFKQEIESDCR